LTLVSLPGGELLDSVVSSGSWTEGKAAGVVKQLLETLKGIHAQNIVHMDIKVRKRT
jgi:serine/threonine protein kinase